MSIFLGAIQKPYPYHYLLLDRHLDLESTLIPLKSIVKENKRLEPLVIGKNGEQIGQIYAQDARMLRALGNVRTAIMASL